MNEKNKIVMQHHCIYCKREQYAPAVSPISHGEHPCVWCGKTSPIITEYEEYKKELEKEIENGREE